MSDQLAISIEEASACFNSRFDYDYHWYVDQGKRILKQQFVHQAVLGFYATKVCTIRHGGRSNGLYTISDYAKDLGLNPKTLSEWVAIYRRVIQHLGIDPLKMSSHEWKAARRIAYTVEGETRSKNKESKTPRSKKVELPDKERINKLFKENLEGPSFKLEAYNWSSTLRTMAKNLSKRDLSMADESSLIEIMESADRISDTINEYLTSKAKRRG